MKLILPIAGEGTRLRPHTHTVPKALIQVGGKAIIAHILDEILPSIEIDEVIFIVGRLGEKVKDYIKEHYDIEATYIEQTKHLGLGHAVFLARDRFKRWDPTFIVYGDTIFNASLKEAIREVDGCIGVREVEDPKRFGIVDVENGVIKKLVEKPQKPTSNLAVVGVNYIRNTKLLFTTLEQMIEKGKKTRGEFQLTDAFQLMIEEGARLETFAVDEWYDCGKPETLLLTNRYILKKNGYYEEQKETVILPPVYIHPAAEVRGSVIGPYVSISENARIVSSIIKDSIIGKNAYIDGLVLTSSIIGEQAVCKGTFKHLNVGDSSSVEIT
ncbi:nucleotidyl transferase [candidate division WOR-3 bacterium JGI_Cruoil_03_44_89]|uniref:Nucleotidyl transferase n=1 Tax=candidate division WOR-3 bacterium JGI_Cruoil_03_44_89 TaxID=1973748 RepID=A0A235BP36_UNCW3|nr:MAG: nucleotidyl transferase [candidate division WOR-3 bacterium JGI_Cruoil_03_44_89]